MKVVLAEEDAGMRAFIRSMLAGQVATVIEVASAWDCLAITMATAPDAVLLGAIDLYDERGRELPALLRRAHPTVRLLVLGARAPSARQGPGTGVDGFLPYPFGTQGLLQAMTQQPSPKVSGLHGARRTSRSPGATRLRVRPAKRASR